MVIDRVAFLRDKAKRAALEGDSGPTRKRQEDLLSLWVGKRFTLEFLHALNPVDPVEGLMESLRYSGISSPEYSFGVQTQTGKAFRQDGDSSPYEVKVVPRAIPVRSNHAHLEGLVMDAVTFQALGDTYLRVSTRKEPDEIDKPPTHLCIYRIDRKNNNIWVKLDEKSDLNSADKKWIGEKTRVEDFLYAAAKNSVRQQQITVERFGLNSNPSHLEPSPRNDNKRLRDVMLPFRRHVA